MFVIQQFYVNSALKQNRESEKNLIKCMYTINNIVLDKVVIQ